MSMPSEAKGRRRGKTRKTKGEKKNRENGEKITETDERRQE